MHRPIDWRTVIPALDDVYMFQGALYCEDCGQAIQKEIRKDGRAPEDEDDEGSYDSDDFPKGPFGDGGGEADSVHHCDSNEGCLNAIKLPCGSKIGAWLGNDLTSEGAEWLSNSIKEGIFRDDEHGRQVTRLWRLKYGDSVSPLNAVGPVSKSNLEASPLVNQFIRDMGGLQPQLHHQIWSDQDSLYGFTMEGPAEGQSEPDTLRAWKADVRPDGSLEPPQTVDMPASEAHERPIQDILEELIGEGAWG